MQTFATSPQVLCRFHLRTFIPVQTPIFRPAGISPALGRQSRGLQTFIPNPQALVFGSLGPPKPLLCPSVLLWTEIAEGLYEQGQKSLKGCKCVSFFAEGLYSLQPFSDFCPPKVREGRFCCLQPLRPQSQTLRGVYSCAPFRL